MMYAEFMQSLCDYTPKKSRYGKNHKLGKISDIFVNISKEKRAIFLIGSVQEVFCGLRFRSNRFKHLVKRFDRFGLATLVSK